MDVYANKTEKVKTKVSFLKEGCIDFERRPINRQFVYKETEILVRGNCRKQRESYVEEVLLILSLLLSLCLRASHPLLSDRSDWLGQSLELG